MSRTHFIPSLILIALLGITALAQDKGINAPPPPPSSVDGPPDGSRQGYLRELGLSKEQLERIRTINRERRTAIFEAQEKLREANRALDEAIYADDASEELINERINAVRDAQGAALRARSMTEYQIRRVLNAEQLKSFREARRRFGEGQQGPRPDKGPGGRGPGQRPPGDMGPGKGPGGGRPPGGGQRPPNQ